MKTPSEKARRAAEQIMEWMKRNHLDPAINRLERERALVTMREEYVGGPKVKRVCIEHGFQQTRDEIANVIDEAME
jgi:hypothetical protein